MLESHANPETAKPVIRKSGVSMTWRSGTLAALAVAALLSACGGSGARSPEAVARAWSAALNRSDDDSAAKLFAPGAEIVQDDALVLHTHAQAVAWNASLPCGGTITRVVHERQRDQVLVVFKLKERPGHRCDAPGQDAAALFQVDRGKIVLWHQTAPPGTATTTPSEAPV
jgi:hypothetical protein